LARVCRLAGNPRAPAETRGKFILFLPDVTNATLLRAETSALPAVTAILPLVFAGWRGFVGSRATRAHPRRPAASFFHFLFFLT
jgi:hypothetical protein